VALPWFGISNRPTGISSTINGSPGGSRLKKTSATKSERDHPWRVLYVDDEPQALKAAKRLADGGEITIETALNAEEGLELLELHEYPVVISDYRMPGINGIQFLERLRHMWPDTVCILTSGFADLDTVVRAINRVGLFRVLLKPWEPSEFKATLRSACRQYELAKENRNLANVLEKRNVELRKVNERLDREVHTRTTQLLVGLLNALDLRDTETRGHSRRVGLYARRLAEELGLGPEECLEVERGALLHDVGKIGVSDAILLKKGPLTDEEWVFMRMHTIFGFNIIRPIDFLESAASIVRSHHERYDGKGYPDGLSGSSICIGARVFAVIDTYDAMTSDRPYRKALDPSIAREEIELNRGSQFDPRCVDAFLHIPQDDINTLKARITEAHQTPDALVGSLETGRSHKS